MVPMIIHTSMFDDIEDGELHELVVRACHWYIEARHAFLITGTPQERGMVYEFEDLLRALRVEQQYRRAREQLAVAS